MYLIKKVSCLTPYQITLDGYDDGEKHESPVQYTDKDLSEIVEGALKQADRNNDGYIDYVEYRSVTA
ncbi:hypothetical protein KGM_215138 [Danaus plexippus plexippus]|uniref:EF-hand domain-containing protein n=1 Tax=Danaus plexippus plexippus TaxID=278856 RepID=A0A212EYQ9_DANPL|nr:hypothetical protein KGM_215138 [Danaus plexippus plexippus]